MRAWALLVVGLVLVHAALTACGLDRPARTFYLFLGATFAVIALPQIPA